MKSSASYKICIIKPPLVCNPTGGKCDRPKIRTFNKFFNFGFESPVERIEGWSRSSPPLKLKTFKKIYFSDQIKILNTLS